MSSSVVYFVVLFLLTFVGIFVNPESWGAWGRLLFKIALFGGISVVLYRLWSEYQDETEEDESEVPDEQQLTRNLNLFFDNQAALFSRALHKNPEVMDLLKKQFSVIWNLILPHNGFLLLMLPKREIILLHKIVRNDIFRSPKNKPIPVLNLIDSAQGFLVENHVQNGSNLIPFYAPQSYVPRSFLAFRTELAEELYLYWLFDAELADFFNEEDRATLNKINDLTMTYLSNVLIMEKLKEEAHEKSKMLELMEEVASTKSLRTAVERFCDFLAHEFQASKLTIAFRKDFDLNQARGMVFYAIGKEDPFKAGTEFVLEEGLNGWVILKNRPYLLDDIEKGEYFVPRFSRQEKTNYGLRAFLSVPVEYQEQAIGMVTLEDEKSGKFKITDKERLQRYTALFSNAINRLIYEKQVGG
ncbi:GAF domain-containing protein [Caldithrix abyssi]